MKNKNDFSFIYHLYYLSSKISQISNMSNMSQTSQSQTKAQTKAQTTSQKWSKDCQGDKKCTCSVCRDIPPQCSRDGCKNEACPKASWTVALDATGADRYHQLCHNCQEKDRIAKLHSYAEMKMGDRQIQFDMFGNPVYEGFSVYKKRK